MTTHCSIFAWEILRRKEPGGLQGVRQLSCRHDMAGKSYELDQLFLTALLPPSTNTKLFPENHSLYCPVLNSVRKWCHKEIKVWKARVRKISLGRQTQKWEGHSQQPFNYHERSLPGS